MKRVSRVKQDSDFVYDAVDSDTDSDDALSVKALSQRAEVKYSCLSHDLCFYRLCFSNRTYSLSLTTVNLMEI
jgi:hypothetical protein